MTDPMLTNEMKRHPVIVVSKADHGDLKIARFLSVARSFADKIRKEIEKENDNVMSGSKPQKKILHVLIRSENPNLYIKLSRQSMKTEINQWG